MCPPVLLAASLAISLASGIASHMAQQQQANAQTKYQEAMGNAQNAANLNNAESAIREQTEQSTAERTSQMQSQAASAQAQFDLRQEALKAQGQAAASSQASGGAFDMLMADYKRVQAQKKDVMQEQLKMNGVQHDFAVGGLHDRADSRIKAQQGFIASPVTQPSWVLTGLGIAGDMTNKYIAYEQAKKGK